MIKSRRMRCTVPQTSMRERREMQTKFHWEKQVRKPLRKLRRRWKDNIKMYLRNIVCIGFM
jgi:hypothetical protein